MRIGDLVVRKSYEKDITFKIINIKTNEDGKEICELKGVNIRIEADSPVEDLEIIENKNVSKMDRVFNEKITASIKKVLAERSRESKSHEVYSNNVKKVREKNSKKSKELKKDEELTFGRPGRILHIDGDAEYLEVCLKTYKELSLEAVGKAINEKQQASQIVDLVKEVKPDIVVITGHDGVIKGTEDYMNLKNYRNSKHFIDAVHNLRNHDPDYDSLVIFAGACQSCYEAILDAGTN